MARPRLPSFGVRRAGALAGLSLSCLVGCDGDLINLGSSEPLALGGDTGAAGGSGGGGTQAGGAGTREWIPQVEPVLIQTNYSIANATLTSDRTQLFFSRQLFGSSDPHVFQALPSGDGFLNPDKDDVPLMLGEDDENGAASPAISTSGKELWFGKGVAGSDSGTDIYVTRPGGAGWLVPERVDELSSELDDSPRPPGLGGQVMPLSSKRHGGKLYQIYLATRATPGGVWGTPSSDLLTNINSTGHESVDGFLTDDGLTLLFASTRGSENHADLFRARRTSIDQAFGEPEALVGIARDADERDPWLSEDGSWLYYSSNRTGLYAIYRARRVQ